ncbi:hypothetical protein TNCV_787081 [Trichonephila clavipes]|nr:hypothetical protein TNCV_787081 [Trichonephila clavipes]
MWEALNTICRSMCESSRTFLITGCYTSLKLSCPPRYCMDAENDCTLTLDRDGPFDCTEDEQLYRDEETRKAITECITSSVNQDGLSLRQRDEMGEYMDIKTLPTFNEISEKVSVLLDTPTVSSEEFAAVNDDNVCTTRIMAEPSVVQFPPS